MEISVYDVFELNRVMHTLIEQQSSYPIQIAFKIHNLIKWLDETEKFLFERINLMFGNDTIDVSNPLYSAFLSSRIPLVETSLTIDELLDTNNTVNVDVNDIGVLEKLLYKTESE